MTSAAADGGHLHSRADAAGDRDHLRDRVAHERGAGLSRSPSTTLNTPAGRNSAISSAIHTVLAGVVSDGFSTIVLPAASAGAHFHTAIIAG